MPGCVEQDEVRFVVRLDAGTGISDAAGLQRMLLEGLESGREVQFDLESVEEIDVSLMQLLQASLHGSGRTGSGVAIRLSEAAETALREAGFAIDDLRRA